MILAAVMTLASYGCKQKTSSEDGNVPFEIAKNYFFNNDRQIPSSPKITTGEEFGKLFGMAAVMGKDGEPTAIDFDKQFVLAIVLPVTSLETEITPVSLECRNDSLFYTYNIRRGDKQSFSIRPMSAIILDKKYEDKELVMLDEAVGDYYTAIDNYLTDKIAGFYSEGEISVPACSIVAVNDIGGKDIRVWGDYWVYNYKQEGDTLKCVSGGSHPGLMHILQTGGHYAVTAFDEVADGSDYLPSAKRIFGEYFESYEAVSSDAVEREILRAEELRAFARDHGISATKYQDYGWPARDLEVIVYDQF